MWYFDIRVSECDENQDMIGDVLKDKIRERDWLIQTESSLICYPLKVNNRKQICKATQKLSCIVDCIF